jgi:hypothetical protein
LKNLVSVCDVISSQSGAVARATISDIAELGLSVIGVAGVVAGGETNEIDEN